MVEQLRAVMPDWVIWIGMALLGRLVAYEEYRRGKGKKFWSPEIWFELPIAVLMTVIVHSVAAYFNFPDTVELGLMGAGSYLGPRAIHTYFTKKAGEDDNAVS